MMSQETENEAISFRGWQHSPSDQIFQIKNKYLFGTSQKMIKNYVEIFISGSRNIELLIFTMKTKYFCSAVVLEGFEI